MNVFTVVLISAAVFAVAYATYGRFLSNKVFRLDNSKKTPANELNDGVDYVPAKKGMLIGQHFSAIAAAGPINGPIIAALLFGWVPAMIWVIVGSIFIGGVHDMGSLVASIRNKAHSITDIIRSNVSPRAWILSMIFIWIALVYVIIAFTDITASSFVGMITLETGETVKGGAIATSSLLYCLLPMIMGVLIRYGKLKEWMALVIFLPLVGVAIWGGKYIPLELPFADIVSAQRAWCLIILAYCFVAAILPIWLVLQPRGAIGGYFLYASLIVCAIGLAFGNHEINYPAFTNLSPDNTPGPGFWFPMFPVLFITVACGACSGFHSLISSGTTSKQLMCERDAKPVGYGTMLLEGLVAMISIAFVMMLSKDSAIAAKSPNFVYASGIGDFMQLIGIPAVFGISFGLMAFTTFVYDTLDVCTRLGRYIIEELTGLKNLRGKILSTLLTAGVPVFFIFQTFTDASGSVVPVWKLYWNTFGASNQLLAAIALFGITAWLYAERRDKLYWLVTFLPALFMFAISNWALAVSIYEGFVLHKGHISIPCVSVVLMALSILVAIETVITFAPGSKIRKPA